MGDQFDFNAVIERRGTGSLKWDHYARGVLPLWVADMDFPVAEAVKTALHERVEHGIFGYSLAPPELEEAVVERLRRLYGMSVEREWIVWLPGLVPGFNLAARAFGMAQGEVLTSTPVYPPFLRCGEHNGHRTEGVPLQQVGDTWTIDFDALEAAITPNTYMFLLCSPHNPTGRLWRRSELEKLADFCLRHELIICSDEIHCDLLLEESRPHIPTCSLGDEVADRTVTLMAPSKTFNVAGLNCSFAVISNAALRSRYRTAMAGLVSFVNALGYTAALAAYRDGEEWLSQVLGCLRENHAYTYDRIKGIPGLGMTRVEATYLAWIDARALGTDDPFKLFVEHGVALSDGKQFGMPGFVRLNFACPHSILAEALDRMEHAARCARGDVL